MPFTLQLRAEMADWFWNAMQELSNCPIPLSLSSPLSNLRKIEVYTDINEISNREICVLGCFLQSTPALEMMEFLLTDDADSENPLYTRFLQNVIYLNRVSKQARILIWESHWTSVMKGLSLSFLLNGRVWPWDFGEYWKYTIQYPILNSILSI